MGVIQTNLKYNGLLVPLYPEAVIYQVVHHLKAKFATPEDIHKWHLDNGWSGAGYNEYIKKDGTVYILRGDNVGSHCKGFNSVSYGIALEGDYDTESTIPIEQYNSLIKRLKYHSGRFPKATIVGHKELVSTDCPGKYFDMEQLKNDVKGARTMEHWAKKYFDFIQEQGLGLHEERFDDNITRGELFKVIALMLGYKEE